MAMFAERIDRRDARARRGGRPDALHRPPRGDQRGAHRPHGLGGGRDRRQRADHALRRLQLRRARRDPRRRRGVRRGRGGGVPEPPLRAGDARPRPADPHQRRAADLQLPALAVRLLGVRLPRRALAGLQPRGLPRPRSTSTRSASGASGRGSDARGPRPALVPVRARTASEREPEEGAELPARARRPARLRRAGRAEITSGAEPTRRRGAVAACSGWSRRCRRPPRAWWSRSPGSSSRSRSSAIGGARLRARRWSRSAILGLREFFRMARPDPADRAAGIRRRSAGDGDRRPLRRAPSRSCWSSPRSSRSPSSSRRSAAPTS